MHTLTKEAARFIVAGAAAVVTDVSVYYALLTVLSHSPAKALSFVVGTVVSYLMNKFWTFRRGGKSYTEMGRFAALYGATLGANVGMNKLTLTLFPSKVFFAFLVATGTSATLNFIGQKWWVFKHGAGAHGKPLLLSSAYFPKHTQNLMQHVGDVAHARGYFLTKRPSNLAFLLEKRYVWMNDYIKPGDRGVEVGAAHGLSKLFIKDAHMLLTDFEKHPWIDMQVDALRMPFKDASFDYIVSSNMIHHLAHPAVFFEECARVLKPRGRLLINEINASLAMRCALRLMRHEGYSFDVDIFDPNVAYSNPNDPWSANCAIPNLLFDDVEKFERALPYFKMAYHHYSEFFTFALSGGVTAKTRTVQLPRGILKMIDALDDALIALCPHIFPLQRKIVLERVH